ncbi:MAG: TaqI-like C-terminal specificity domain-containing protein, partial [Nitrosotalea sp.]
GLNEAFLIDEGINEEIIRANPKNSDLIKPFLTGAEIKRYAIKSKKNHIILTKIGVDIHKYPEIFKHLSNFQEALEKRWDKGDYWYELRACAYYDSFDKPKIIWGNLTKRSSFTLDEKYRFYVNAPACILSTNSKYVLGILNSKLMTYFLKSISAERQGGYIEQKPVYVSQVPIKKSSEHQKEEINQLVEKMLSLNQRINEMGDKNTNERAKVEEEINKVDTEIDELVYKIYGLDEAERKIVEDSIK